MHLPTIAYKAVSPLAHTRNLLCPSLSGDLYAPEPIVLLLQLTCFSAAGGIPIPVQ